MLSSSLPFDELVSSLGDSVTRRHARKLLIDDVPLTPMSDMSGGLGGLSLGRWPGLGPVSCMCGPRMPWRAMHALMNMPTPHAAAEVPCQGNIKVCIVLQ